MCFVLKFFLKFKSKLDYNIMNSLSNDLLCTSLVYIHIGNPIPDYLYDNIHQTLLMNDYKVKIYVIIEDSLIKDFNEKINCMEFDIYTKGEFFYKNIIQVVPLSILDRYLNERSAFDTYKKVVSEKFGELSQFRGGFWVSTTARFYYIGILMEIFDLENVFHIENDVLLYNSAIKIYKNICKYFHTDKIEKICMVQDSPNRVIPSILYFPNVKCINGLTEYITSELVISNSFINDMDILGSYQDKLELPFKPDGDFIFDGAAFGQYLGGVDYKNISIRCDKNDIVNNQKNLLIQYNNHTRGFVNETALVKPNLYNYFKSNVLLDHLKNPIKVYTLEKNDKTNIKLCEIVNLHIHSKQLYQFSSVFDVQYNSIITGDRVLSLCDFVILTNEILNFHKDINKYARDIITIRDFTNIKINLLNSYFTNFARGNGRKYIKLFVYTHILYDFQKWILPYLDSSLEYVIYTHNSDHSLDLNYEPLLKSKLIKHIYSQNVDIVSDKVSLLPIGIANSMWRHGNLLELYTVIKDTWKYKKTKSIYVNINPNTYDYRKVLLEKIKTTQCFNLANSKPYIEYLYELASHRFCLCIRGNGIDTHRFWESLYLGVIPVLINNKTTQSENFIRYLRKTKIPFYEIRNDNLDMMFARYNDEHFTKELYMEIVKVKGVNLFDIDELKLSHYEYKMNTDE